MTEFTFTSGIDNFTGPDNTINNFRILNVLDLTSTDVATGGNSTDFLGLAAGAYTQAQFAGVSSMESFGFFGGGVIASSAVLTANIGATASGGRIAITADGSLTLDGSAIGASCGLDFYTQGAMAWIYDITLGAGDDSFSFNSFGPLAGSQFDGGAGSDVMFIGFGAPLGVKIDGNFANIEKFALINGSSATVAAGYSMPGFLNVTLNAGANSFIVETGATVAIAALCSSGTDTIDISSAVIRNDEINFDVAGLAGTDIINAGGGTDDILRFRDSGTVTAAQLAGVTAVEHVIFNMNATNEITLNATMLINVAAAAIRVDGADGADTISAASFNGGQALRAYGFGGVDNLSGGNGNDLLDGGTGADFMVGGNGNDNYYVDNAGDVIVEFSGALGGTDFVFSSISLQAATSTERLILTGTANINATGRAAQNDILFGNSGANVLDGLSGFDNMRGGLGNDIYYVDHASDTTDEAIGGGGTDFVYSSISFTAAQGIERLYLTGTANINANGRAAQNDILIGNSGNNILNGFSGNDLMRGGLGNDTYYVDSATDTTDEVTGGGGTGDFVYSSVSFAAAQGIERLYLTGTAAINGTGRDGQNDILIGNAGINTLNGLTGNDVLIGGLGNDILTGGAGLDTFRFDTALNAAANMDTVTDFIAADDTMQLENAIFTLLGVTGTLAAGLFKDLALGAQDANDVIIYNRATGALFYDTNGLTAGGQTQFADLTNGLIITNADFVVI